MNTHHRTVHLKLKPHACPVEGCNKAYGHKHLLKKHMKMHAEAKASGGSLTKGGLAVCPPCPPADPEPPPAAAAAAPSSGADEASAA
eukprot:COSAG04_NODE_10403_length_779_cov_2.213235_2_plen_86_part_01